MNHKDYYLNEIVMEGYKPVPEKEIDNSEMSEEQLEERERELSGEISESIDEITKTTESVEELLEDKELSPTLKEVTLEKINEIGRKVSDRFAKRMLGSALAGSLLAGHQFLMEQGETFIEEGSVLGDANPVALAAVGLYASIRSLKFVVAKLEERNVKNNLDRGTIDDATEAGSFIGNAIKEGDIDDSQDNYDLKHLLWQEGHTVYDEVGLPFDHKRTNFDDIQRRVEIANKRTASEMSKYLRSGVSKRSA